MSLTQPLPPEPDDDLPPHLFAHADDSVSQTLEKMSLHYAKTVHLSVGELLEGLRHRGFALLMLVLVLPNCVPVPIPPGGSTLFSIPLLFIAAQMIWGSNSPWLPAWLRRKKLEFKLIRKVIAAASPRLRWVEKFLHRRWEFASTKGGERVIGFIWLCFAISIAVPLPMTNFVPGIGILVMSLGMLGRDGVVIAIGAFIGILGTAFTTLLLLFGTQAALSLFSF